MNANDERALFLRERLRDRGLLTADVAAQLEVPWRYHRVTAYCVFFLLAALGLAAFYALCSVLEVPRAGVVTAIVAIAVAEWLIRSARWFHTGVEAALWLGAVLAAISELPSRGTPESLLVVAAAFAVAGARVRNPLIGAIAAAFVAHYFEKRFDLGVVAALVLATGALFALLRTWRRPTTEWLFIVIALLLPATGWPDADERWRTVTIILYLLFAAIAFALGCRRRHHPFFFASMIATAFAATELLRALEAIPLEAKLALAGTIVFAATFGISRALRDRKQGLVTAPSRESDESLLVLTALTPNPTTEAPPDATQPGGGQFGGAGASGNY